MMLYAGLLHYNYDWTLDQVMEMVPIRMMSDVSAAVMEAFNASMADETQQDSPSTSKKKASSTGGT